MPGRKNNEKHLSEKRPFSGQVLRRSLPAVVGPWPVLTAVFLLVFSGCGSLLVWLFAVDAVLILAAVEGILRFSEA